MVERLDEKTIEKVAALLTWLNICKIAVEYMAFDLDELERIWMNQSPYDVTRAMVDVLKTFSRRAGEDAKQKLEFYLRDSQLVDPNDLNGALGVGNGSYPRLQPKTKKKFSTRMLGKLADLSTRSVESVALSHLEVDFDKIEAERFHAPRSSWLFNLAIFDAYAKKPKSSLENLKSILLDSKKFDPYKLNDIFDEDAQNDTATGSGDAEPIASGLRSEMTERIPSNDGEDVPDNKYATQLIPNGGKWTSEQAMKLIGVLVVLIGVFIAAVLFGQDMKTLLWYLAPFVVLAALLRKYYFVMDTYSDLVNPAIADIAKILPASSLYPLGRPCKKLLNYYKWLHFDEIKNTTKRWKKRRPVVIAVLDTGIDEDHEKLRDKILKDKSKCLVNGEEDDLRQDKNGHGTMVAGIIAENGPENVQIINIKVIKSDGTSDMATLIKALNYVKNVKVKDQNGSEYGVEIVNMSLGRYERSEELDSILPDLSVNKILVAAAGNEGARLSEAVEYPAQHDNVICVGAHDAYGHESYLSARGDKVDFLCPGEHVASTRSRYRKGPLDYVLDLLRVRPMYYIANGTSFACPYAVAAASHILIAMEGLRGPDNREKLCSSMVMRNVLKKLSDANKPKVLRAHEKGFQDINDLWGHCDRALKH